MGRHFNEASTNRYKEGHVGAFVLRVAAVLAVLALLPGALALALPLAPMQGDAQAQGATSGDASAPSLAPGLASAGTYAISFKCAGTGEDTAAATATCPQYVLDREDIMAQPLLLADPDHPQNLAFNALHGGKGIHPAPGDDSPSERSRDDSVHQPHTTFVSTNGGVTWDDHPYYTPDSMRKSDGSRSVYGEDNAAALDKDGRLYLASLYSYRDRAGGAFGSLGSLKYAVGVWKLGDVSRGPDYHSNVKVLQANGSVDSVHLANAAKADAIVLLWRETPAAGVTGGNATPFVQVYHTRPSQGAIWTKVDAPAAEGCTAITDPVVLDASVYFACRTDAAWRIVALDATTWTARTVSDVPVQESHGLLLKRGDDGLMVLITSGLAPDGKAPSVRLSYGGIDGRWSDGEDVAAKLTQAAAGVPVSDARVTAAIYAPESGNLHLVYLERVEAARTGSPNVDRPEFTKVLASVQAEGAFQGLVDLQVGRVSRADASPSLTGVGSGAYADLHDSLVLDAAGHELIAYGDYGFVRFAQVVETDFLPPLVPLGTGTPPIPLASAGINPALIAAPAGLLSGAMVARTLMAKRKAAVETPSE